jgi:hypothetical protein
MKKLAFVSAIVFAGLFAGKVSAQSTSDQVTLNIKLKPVYTLIVDGGQKTVDLVYQSREDYAGGVTQTKNNHLKVYSTGGFEVKVKTNGDFQGTGGKSIAANTVSVLASNGDLDANNSITPDYSSVNLSTGDTRILSSDKGGVDHKFNVTYTGANNHAYINNYFGGNGGESVYTATVTYTILGL